MCLNMLDLRCVLLLVHCSKGGQLTGNRFSWSLALGQTHASETAGGCARAVEPTVARHD